MANNIDQIMRDWSGGKTPVAVSGPSSPKGVPRPSGIPRPSTPMAAAAMKPKPRGVPGLMSTRNNLRNLRRDTLPKKGMK